MESNAVDPTNIKSSSLKNNKKLIILLIVAAICLILTIIGMFVLFSVNDFMVNDATNNNGINNPISYSATNQTLTQEEKNTLPTKQGIKGKIDIVTRGGAQPCPTCGSNVTHSTEVTTVTITSATDHKDYKITSDAAGNFSIDLPIGMYSLMTTGTDIRSIKDLDSGENLSYSSLGVYIIKINEKSYRNLSIEINHNLP